MTPLATAFALVRNFEHGLGAVLDLHASGHLTSFEALDLVRDALRLLTDARGALEREMAPAPLPAEVPEPATGVIDEAPCSSRRLA